MKQDEVGLLHVVWLINSNELTEFMVELRGSHVDNAIVPPILCSVVIDVYS